MTLVSVTRLRLRSVWFVPAFFLHTMRTLRQVRRAEGFLGGSLLPDRRWTFWTLTAWDSPADMRRYRAADPHLEAMRKLPRWCDEASVVHWEQPGTALPDWNEADRRMRTEGRPSKVNAPSPDHAALRYAPPRTATAAPITRVAGKVRSA